MVTVFKWPLSRPVANTLDMSGVIIFILFGVLVIGGLIWGTIAARKRREAMAELAARLGLGFRPGKDHALADGYSFLNKLRKGSNRYAFNTQ